MSTNVLSKKQQYLVVTFATVLSLLVVWGVVSGATTISTSISTGGTLTVTGVSSFTNASTSAMFTAVGGFISNASSTVAAAFNVGGAADLDSTLNVDGLSTVAGYISTASSTVVGVLSTSGNINASSTIFATGDLRATSTATTTVAANSSGKIGGCIQVSGSNGGNFRMYVGNTDVGVGAGTTTAGRNGTVYFAFWESGTCE